MMNSVLVISSGEKSTAFFMEILNQQGYDEIVMLKNGGISRRTLTERDFDLCIINAPLSDESGERLAIDIASSGLTQVILIIKAELYDEICEKVEDYGVLTVAKPINKQILWNALKLANAAHHRLTRLKSENNKLLQKIEDIRVIDRAKCTLMGYLKMSEEEAHRYLEKQAMDRRTSKREVANQVLKTYE